ncbi:TolC family protein [Mesoterricola silvestris]|uniref:Multidrug transporter n=1 Tax=Mesoterricola silvestris TaxID=2927979 RepID=A0AA48K8P7_9BACT|nr:TolC family protein [Mesoterricola silvestris]BDU73144.1 multidrug transporter [Mesoterricola silvestris]
MRQFVRLALGIIPVVGWAQLQAQSPIPPSAPYQQSSSIDDPLLRRLIQEALDRNPSLAQAKALVEAEKERIPQAKVLPDPSLTLGLQNDGFKGIQVGKMETSYYQVMVTQPLPWPGKRALRGDIATLGAEAARSTTDRTRLTLIADLKRAYYGLLLVRGQLDLLDQQAMFWQKASDITRVRYEVGQGSQADLLRAQLEQNRIRQARLALNSQEGVLLATLNRLRGAGAAESVPTTARIADLAPQAPAVSDWLQRAEKESPELQAARIGARQAERSLDLAKRDRYPDFAVSAGLMPRGGLDPMWQVGVSISLPIWSRQKQQRAVHEQEYRRTAQGSEAENVRNLLGQRIQERATQFQAAQETLKLYKEGLLVQSESSFQANLAQYEAGRAPFLSVLEALNGWIADRGGYLQAVAQVLSLQIAQEEFNLTGTPTISAQSLNSAAMGMGGSPSGASTASSLKSGATPASGGDAGSGMKSM